ncbi:hypothetical protein Mal64_08890 [Pseudobythopirellula maris]|uniref:PEP-CTERM protein-sorting domain-containing protein n=1 Tax=Pseudobythopirellula maris TaxID=2527991 RepID=A0A5C5ZU00_9BACT|nr:hypothetical protein [Pseudobythopirellula maris]TWT90498.1 hypothetical protein Mal64_08890 [Pseudobythopirellula maris]
MPNNQLNHHRRIRGWAPGFLLAFLTATVFFAAAPAQASIEGLGTGAFIEQSGWSDISVGFVSGGYDSTSGALTAAGMVQAIEFGMGGAADYSGMLGVFNIAGLIVDNSGTVTTAGSLVVSTMGPLSPTGSLPGFPAGVLLSATVTEAFIVAANELQLGFTVTGGSAAEYFGDPGGMGGVKISLVGVSSPSFSNSFSFSLQSADILGAPIPEASSWLVFAGLALTHCGYFARKYRRLA